MSRLSRRTLDVLVPSVVFVKLQSVCLNLYPLTLVSRTHVPRLTSVEYLVGSEGVTRILRDRLGVGVERGACEVIRHIRRSNQRVTRCGALPVRIDDIIHLS